LSLGITFDRTKESGGGCSLRLLCDEPRRRGLVVGDLALLCERRWKGIDSFLLSFRVLTVGCFDRRYYLYGLIDATMSRGSK
jgi:hypothetical protein